MTERETDLIKKQGFQSFSLTIASMIVIIIIMWFTGAGNYCIWMVFAIIASIGGFLDRCNYINKVSSGKIK